MLYLAFTPLIITIGLYVMYRGAEGVIVDRPGLPPGWPTTALRVCAGLVCLAGLFLAVFTAYSLLSGAADLAETSRQMQEMDELFGN